MHHSLLYPLLMSIEGPRWISLAHVLRPQGRKGEVLAEVLTDFPETLVGRAHLYLVSAASVIDMDQARSVNVASMWHPVGKNRGKVVLHFDGSSSISDAESLAGLNLSVLEKDRLPLEAESVYIGDLVGCTLYDQQEVVGEITGVQFPATGDGSWLEDVPSLFEVHSPEGDEILIPFAKDFVISLDTVAKKVVLRLPIGLVDVNR